jgi:hypothetical protein
VFRRAPERLSALRPPLDSGERSKVANPGRKNAPRERDRLFDIVRSTTTRAVAVSPFAPSPLVGEGTKVCPRTRMGEGARHTTPSPHHRRWQHRAALSHKGRGHDNDDRARGASAEDGLNAAKRVHDRASGTSCKAELWLLPVFVLFRPVIGGQIGRPMRHRSRGFPVCLPPLTGNGAAGGLWPAACFPP